MLLLSIFLFSLLPFTSIGVPLGDQLEAKHPSIDVLDNFAKELGGVTREIKQYKGQNPKLFDKIILHGETVIKLLHAAGDTWVPNQPIDYGASAIPFVDALGKVSKAVYSFSDVVVTKVNIVRAENKVVMVYGMLDYASKEAGYLINSMKKQAPAWLMSMTKSLHNELVGSLALAKEAFRPTDAEIDDELKKNNKPQ